MIVVEKLEPCDGDAILAIAELEHQIFSDSWSRVSIEDTVKQKQAFCAVAKEEEAVLGYFLCYYVLDECEIARIAVREDARRRGIGQSLFSHMLDQCRERGIGSILLDVRENNSTAIEFYKRQGFVVDGIRKNFYGGPYPENAILMSKLLGDDGNQTEERVKIE